MSEFDYIVIGGGTAAACRRPPLEDPDVTVAWSRGPVATNGNRAPGHPAVG